MTSWAGQCVKLLHPLIYELKQSVFSANHLYGDCTPVKVLTTGIGQTKRYQNKWKYVKQNECKWNRHKTSWRRAIA